MTPERLPNPFRPGFDARPPLLVGRGELLDAARDALDAAVLDHITPQPLLMPGPRGVGKSVALGEIADMAGLTYGWTRLHFELATGVPFTPLLVARAHEVVEWLAEGKTKSFELTEKVAKAKAGPFAGELHYTRTATTDEPAVAIERALRAAVQAAGKRGSGIVLTIDELQLIDRGEGEQLGGVLQMATEEEWPIVVLGAGLPAIRDGRLATYFERGTWFELGSVSASEALQALQVPAEDAGRPFTGPAVRQLAAASGGYPFAIQVYGSQAWRHSQGQTTIGARAAKQALLRGTSELERGIFKNRWVQATPKEREYLGALAALLMERDTPTGGDVARRLGVPAQRLSTVREQLLAKGTVLATGPDLRFPVPSMARYIAGLAEATRVAQALPFASALEAGPSAGRERPAR